MVEKGLDGAGTKKGGGGKGDDGGGKGADIPELCLRQPPDASTSMVNAALHPWRSPMPSRTWCWMLATARAPAAGCLLLCHDSITP
jgi:hypothetical protein